MAPYTLPIEEITTLKNMRACTVVRKFAILVSFGILVVFMASDLQGNARVWFFFEKLLTT